MRSRRPIILAGLLGGIFWNLLTWWRGIPSSSSHALIGGVVGAVVVPPASMRSRSTASSARCSCRASSLRSSPSRSLPTVTFLIYRRIRRRDPDETKRSFRVGQIGSASLVALSHGTNDAQKTMGVITLALIANGNLPKRRQRAGVGGRLGGHRHQPGDLYRRLAHHSDPRPRDHQARDPAGLRGGDVQRSGHPRRLAGRLPAVDHARHLGRRHGRGGGQARGRRSTGPRRRRWPSPGW